MLRSLFLFSQVAFFRHFVASVTKVDYLTMRHGFINVCIIHKVSISLKKKKKKKKKTNKQTNNSEAHTYFSLIFVGGTTSYFCF